MKYYKTPAIAEIEGGNVVEIVKEVRLHGDVEIQVLGTARLIARRPSYKADNIPYILQERDVKGGEPTCNVWSSQRWEVEWVQPPPRRKAGDRETLWVHFHVGLRKDVESAPLIEETPSRRGKSGLLPRKTTLFVHSDLLRTLCGEEAVRRLRREMPATVILHAQEAHHRYLWADGYTPDVENASWADDIKLWLDMNETKRYLILHRGITLLPELEPYSVVCESLNKTITSRLLQEEE